MVNNTFYFDPERIKEANKDVFDRIEKEGVTAVYDATLDSLFIEIGGPKKALSEHLVDNIMIRVEPDTLRVVGFEILDFLEDFLPHNRLARYFMGDWVPSRDSDSSLTLVESQLPPIKSVVEALIQGWKQSQVVGST